METVSEKDFLKALSSILGSDEEKKEVCRNCAR